MIQQRYDGKIPVEILEFRKGNSGEIIVRDGKGKVFRAVISLSEKEEILGINKRISPLFLVGSFDVNTEETLSTGEALALLLAEIETLSADRAASSKFVHVVIDRDNKGKYFSILIDEQGNRRKLRLGIGIVISKYMGLELFAKKDLFEDV